MSGPGKSSVEDPTTAIATLNATTQTVSAATLLEEPLMLSRSAPRSACSQITGRPAFVSTSFNISPFVAAWATMPSPYPRGARLHLLLLKRT